MYFLDEVLQHLLGNREVRDHAVFHRPDRGDVARRAPEHLFGRKPDFLNHFLAVWSTVLANRDHRWLIEHDAFAAHVNEGVGCAEVDREVVIEVAAEKTKHNRFRLKGKTL